MGALIAKIVLINRKGRKVRKEVLIKMLRNLCVLSDLCGEFIFGKNNNIYGNGTNSKAAQDSLSTSQWSVENFPVCPSPFG